MSGPPPGPGGRSTPLVSRLTTNRLSVYVRCLGQLEAEGVATISSRLLAERFNLNSAQIRKDLAHFGEFGTRGVGYDVGKLRQSLTRILGLDREHRVVIVGAGNLGLALAGYRGFKSDEFRIAALVDSDAGRVARLCEEGWPAHGLEALERVIADERVTIAVLAVPAEAGQASLDRVAAAGIRAVMSFVPAQLRVPEGVELSKVDLKIELERLAFWLSSAHAGSPPA